MKARLIKFGEIEVEGKRYTHDVVIESGKVRKRKKRSVLVTIRSESMSADY
jgi:hypothetical protein